MANNTRKVSFYKICLEKYIDIKKDNLIKSISLSNDEIEDAFKYIYDNHMRELGNSNKAIDVDTYRTTYVVEVIDYDDKMVYLKIGQQNHANTVALRDKNTLETESVPMSSTQLLELFTFCLIDFKTGIVSYIGINGAPRISAIRSLFDNYLIKEQNIHTSLAAIIASDIVDIIAKKNIISKISVTYAVPSDEVLSDIMGLKEKDFDNLHNVKTRTASYNITANRNKKVFKNSWEIKRLLALIKEAHGDNLKSFSVNAKNYKERSQPYDLLQYSFTKTVDLLGENHTIIQENDFIRALKQTYVSNINELLRYTS